MVVLHYGQLASLLCMTEIITCYLSGVTFGEYRLAMLETGNTGKYDLIVWVFSSVALVSLPYAELFCLMNMGDGLQDFVVTFAKDFGHLVSQGKPINELETNFLAQIWALLELWVPG